MHSFELDWLKKWNMYTPHKVALRDGLTRRKLTYSECFRRAHVIAAKLQDKYDLQRGERVAVLAGNSLEYILLFFALQRVGAILVPINYRLTAREVGHILNDSKPKLVLFDNEFEAILKELNELIGPTYKEKMACEQGLFDPQHDRAEMTPNFFIAEPEDVAMILYTSGTTGTPKGAKLSHRMLFWNSINTGLRLNLTQNDRTVIFLPLFHTGGWNVLTTPFLHRGAEVILLPKFDAEQVLMLTAKERGTILFGVPTTMNLMAQSKAFDGSDLSTVRYAIVGGEAMPRTLIETWHKKGIAIRQGYGLTEFGPNVFSLNEEDAIRKIGSIGFPNFYIDTKVVDEQGKEVPTRGIGELILSGPSCMTGYWQNDEATQQTLKDGWLYTGDLVSRDEEGYFYVAGRKKEMFISGGENVYPAEIEQVIHGLPEVREVAVVGVEDSTWGEVGHAYISFREGKTPLTNSELEAHCRSQLAKFKVPKSFHVLTELPKGDSGKILKRKLLELGST